MVFWYNECILLTKGDKNTMATLFQPAVSGIYFTSLVIVTISLMLIMSVRLYAAQRKRTYLALTLSLVIVLCTQLVSMVADAGAGKDDPVFLRFLLQVLQATSLILLNIGVFRLYNVFRARQYVILYLGILGAVAIALAQMLYAGSLQGSEAQLGLVQSIGSDIYLFVILILCYQWISPYIGQWGKYQLSLTVCFVTLLLHMVDTYILEETVRWVTLTTDILPVFYYGILFVILFERVVELLQASYARSITDPLTGLFNRQYFMRRLRLYLAHGVPVSVIFLDIDNFKQLNDTQGHDRGDQAIKQVASIMQEIAEDIGLNARFGGEEMVMLITDPSVKVKTIAENIRQKVEAEAGVTVSVGYSKARRGVTADELVKQADEAMYEAKKTGKNKVVAFKRSTKEKE